MVHIPSKFPELTIKPTKGKGAPSRLASKSTHPKLAALSKGTALTMTKVKVRPTLGRPSASSPVKVNGRPIQRPTVPGVPPNPTGKLVRNPLQLAIPQVTSRKAPGNRIMVNSPTTIMNKFINTQLKINKVPVTTNPNNLKYPIRVQNPRTLNQLPSDITIVKTVSQGCKRKMPSQPLLHRKKQKQNMSSASTTLETVELDDDDLSQASTSSPQWYLRPEEQNEENDSNEPENSLESKNNAEPEGSSKMIEIIIEDSPIKVMQNKRTHEIGAELAITIDDSPIKAVTDKDTLGSDGEKTVDDDQKTPRSKKKLNYPEETEVTSDVATIEIEIEPMDPKPKANNATTVNNCGMNDTVVEIFESPAKPIEGQQNSTPKKDESKRPEITSKHVESLAQTSEDGEFHPIYQKFIDLCFKLENSDDMKKIVEKKIKAYYKQAPQEYTLSEDFIDMVSSKIISMQASPEKMYLYIKDIVDELNLQRKMAKGQLSTTDAKSTGTI